MFNAKACAIETERIQRWIPDALSAAHDTPLTLLLEWMVSESVDLINCASIRCAHKPFVPIVSPHASEWVVSQLKNLLVDPAIERDVERVMAWHLKRCPDPSDVESARNGRKTVVMTAKYGRDRTTLVDEVRLVTDFAPANALSRNPDPLTPTEVAAEISLLARLRDLPLKGSLADVCATTARWLRTLAEHYDLASSAHDSEAAATSSRDASGFVRSAAVDLGAKVVSDEAKVAQCITACLSRVEHVMLRSPRAAQKWSPRDVGFPFGGQWTMLASLPADERAMRDALVCDVCPDARRVAELPDVYALGAILASFDGGDGDGGTAADPCADDESDCAAEAKHKRTHHRRRGRPAKKPRLATDANGAPKPPCAVPKFADRLDIEGMERLIASGWKQDVENIDSVTSIKFRSFVLDVKRRVRNGPKVSRGRAMLPTHEFMEVIDKAIDGKGPMYGYGPGEDDWFDDFDAEKNPAGCPPWVLVAVVTAACVAGLRHVLGHARELRTALESELRARPGAPKVVVDVAGERISLPPGFVVKIHSLVRNKEAPRPWSELDDEEKDSLVLKSLLGAARGFKTLMRHASRSAVVPEWLKLYLEPLGTPFLATEIDVSTVNAAVTSAVSLSQWFVVPQRPCSPPTPALPPPPVALLTAPPGDQRITFEELVKNAIALMKKRGDRVTLGSYVRTCLFNPPGISVQALRQLLASEQLAPRLDRPTANLVGAIAALDDNVAEYVLVLIGSQYGRDQVATDGQYFAQLKAVCNDQKLAANVEVVRAEMAKICHLIQSAPQPPAQPAAAFVPVMVVGKRQ